MITALRKTERPLTAYELLARLRPLGVSAPPTVYRALQRLIDDGLAHRLESLNAFVACAHPHHGNSAMFSICHDCGTAEEFSDRDIETRIAGWAKSAGFRADRAVLEVRGACQDCGHRKTLERPGRL
ncbi:MAG TPA: Fur family transcriptional regulator [Rhizomicrobium sp.]|nr:Fur family transcriptional regulator [Rhizomicrobium sp.]